MLLEVSITKEELCWRRKRIVSLPTQALKDTQISIEVNILLSIFISVFVHVCYYMVWW